MRQARLFVLMMGLILLLARCSRPEMISNPARAARTPEPAAAAANSAEMPALPADTPAAVEESAPTAPAGWEVIPSPLPDEYWPTAGWRTSSPEEQGIDPQKLALLLEAVKQQNLELQSLLLIRNGYIISETYFQTGGENKTHELYSCTKSFISTLLGIAINRGYIDNVQHPVLDFFPGLSFENRDERKEVMTLEDLLTMRSGLDWQEGDPIYQEMYQNRDWIKFVLDKPMRAQPGTEFNYCSGCSHLLSAVIEQATGMSTYEFAQKELFEPLGISNPSWEADRMGIPIGGWGLQLSPRDMAKLGYLYLHKGWWDGRQIIPAGWVEAAVQKHTGTDKSRASGYGYLWWTYPSLDAYTALGRFGQTIFVVPRFNLIVITTAKIPSADEHEPIYDLIEKYIAPAVQAL